MIRFKEAARIRRSKESDRTVIGGIVLRGHNGSRATFQLTQPLGEPTQCVTQVCRSTEGGKFTGELRTDGL